MMLLYLHKINLYLSVLIFLTILFFSCEKSVQKPLDDNNIPQAVILFPANGEYVSGEVVIQARAIDNQEISHVEFYINQEMVHVDSTSNNNDIYTYRWNTISSNESAQDLDPVYAEDEYHYISVIAYDKSGNSYATAPIKNKIDNIDNESPNAFILKPFQGQSIEGNIDITVIASDNDSIAIVKFFINDRLEAIRPSTSMVTEEDQFGNISSYHAYIYTWNTELVDDGYHSIKVIVDDINENSTIVAPRDIIVNNGIVYDLTPPTGTIVSPPAGLTVNGTIPVIVNAADNISVGEVAFSIDGVFQETITSSPYVYLWDTNSASEDSEHIISAIVIDSVGNETPLTPISVFVNNLIDPDIVPPIASIFYPASGQTISGIVDIEISTSDNDGISYVIFFIDGNESYLDEEEPYIYNWNTEFESEDNEHTIAAASCDYFGNCTLTSPITVIVDNIDNVFPSGQILNPFPGQILEGNVTIQFSAYDNEGIMNLVPYINGLPVDTVDSVPYNYFWDTTTETEDAYHVISGIVSDSSNNVFYVNPIVVYIDNFINDINPPSGVISNPVSGQNVNGIVDFIILAQDDQGIDNVEFYINGSSVSIDSDYPYQYSWDTTNEVNNSEHTLSASVSDYSGHTILLQPVLVTIIN